MPELITQEEFDRLLEDQEPDLAPFPVFVQPKKTDRGYFSRRETLMRFQTAQARLATDYQDIQRSANKIDKRTADIRERLEVLETAREASGDAADRDLTLKIDDLKEELERLEDEASPLRTKLLALVTQLDEAIEGQIEIIMPYIRAIKYPQADGSATFWPRPSGGDDLARFESDVRTLLKDVSEEDFEKMTNAITGTANGVRSVPTRNGSR